jgi:hypothetical protein
MAIFSKETKVVYKMWSDGWDLYEAELYVKAHLMDANRFCSPSTAEEMRI